MLMSDGPGSPPQLHDWQLTKSIGPPSSVLCSISFHRDKGLLHAAQDLWTLSLKCVDARSPPALSHQVLSSAFSFSASLE